MQTRKRHHLMRFILAMLVANGPMQCWFVGQSTALVQTKITEWTVVECCSDIHCSQRIINFATLRLKLVVLREM